MSAQTSYLKSCLHMLVKHFHSKEEPFISDASIITFILNFYYLEISDDYVYLNVHQCIRMVCELVPK